MSDRWWDYFQSSLGGRHWLQVAVSQWQFMQPLYGHIQRHVPAGGRILDVGSGLGFNDIYLAALGYSVVGIDNDPRIVGESRRFAERLGVEVDFVEGDAFDLSPEFGRHDLVYSLGVLEHFDREVTIRLLREQMRCADRVLIEIPSRYTAYSDGITDERIYSMGGLKGMVVEAGMEIDDVFGFGNINARAWHLWLRRILPHALYRLLQNRGFAYSLAVVGRTPEPAGE